MGSAVENVENASFVDRVRWSKKTYTLRMLLEFRQPPCIVSVPEGHRGSNDVENLPPGLVVRVNSVFAERRIFARCADGRVFSIPETFPIKFEVIKKNRKRSKAKRLDEILRNYRPPIAVALDRRNNRWTFRSGKTVQSEESLGTMVLLKAYFEHFARVNQLIDGAIDRRVFLIPLYLDLDVRLAEGLRNENTSEYGNLMNMYSKAVGSIDYSAYTGLNAILEFDPSAGSVHPLSASRHHSMETSLPCVSDSRTVTDVPTLAVRGSQASGSQGRARRGRSEDPRPQQPRRRAQSEDFLGTMTLERGGNRLAVKSSETKVVNLSTDGSLSGGSSAEDLELVKETENRGGGGGGGEARMSRRRGRSAEELQERPTTRGRGVTPEVASLDRLPEVSQAMIVRRPDVQSNVRPAKGDNQMGSNSSSRVTAGRGDGQGAREDAAAQASSRSRSRNPVSAVHPTPKPRKERSRGQSENSSMSVPPPAPGTVGQADRQGHHQSTDRTVALNRSQDWSAASPAPNYHIHINIQSPNSPPGLPPPVSILEGHSTVHRTTPASAVQPVRPFLDNGSFEKRPVRRTFARQEEPPRPDLLAPPPVPPQPERHAYLRHEPPTPKSAEAAAVRQSRLRQESYPPRSITETGRYAYVRHAAQPQPPKLSEPIRPTYIRQETYPRETDRWNNSISRRFLREIVPTMLKSRPSEHRSASSSGRVFVSSVSCTGNDLLDLQGKNNFVNEGHRSHGLRSKVIRLKNGDDSEIAEMEVKEFYGRMTSSTIRSTGNYVNPYNLANGDVNSNNNNFTQSSGEYQYPSYNPVFGDKRSNPQSTKRAATKIEIPDTTLQGNKLPAQSTRRTDGGGRARDAQGGRHWILRSGIQKPDNRSAAPRQSLGTTIAV